MQEEIKLVECPECQGEGEIYIDTSRSCMKHMSNCCGGCGYNVPCETCDGEGEIENED
jgi:DnaJ-class molecular chaperone